MADFSVNLPNPSGTNPCDACKKSISQKKSFNVGSSPIFTPITFAKLQTIPVGTADSNRLNHATTMKWRMESHLRNGNTLRTRSCLCRHKSSSSWLSRLPQYQRSDHDS